MKSEKELKVEMAALDAKRNAIQNELNIIYNANLKKEKDSNLELIRKLKEIDFLKIWPEPHKRDDCSDNDSWNSVGCHRCRLIEIMKEAEWLQDYKVEIRLEISEFGEYKDITIP